MPDKWWLEPLRIVQVNLQVVDTPLLQPDEVMRQLSQELHANCVVFNAGGIYAWYPTRVPCHYINPHMEGRDVLGEALEAAHRYGMRFVARVDFTKADDSIYHQHPEWFAKDPDAQPRAEGEPRYGPWSLLYATCTNGAYCGEAVAQPVLQEVLSTYDVDGLFYNGAHYRTCHCGTCRAKYRQRYGEDLPADPAMFRPDWAQASFTDNMRGIYQVCQAVRPDVPWLGHYWLSGATSLGMLGQYADVPCSEPIDYLTGGYLSKRPAWYSGMTARLGRTLIEGTPPIVIIHACTGMEWRHTTVPEHEHRYWLSQVVANGGNLWHTLTGIPNTQYDRRILESVGSFNRVLEEHEKDLASSTAVAPVAVVVSGQSPRVKGGHPLLSYDEELFGFVEALANHQVPFTFLPVEYVTPERLAEFEVLVLPNVRCLSDGHVAAIRAFVEQGGGLVASYETSLFDEHQRCRDTLALGDVLQVEFGGDYLRDLSCSYMRIEDAGDALVSGIANTEVIANQLDMLQVTPQGRVPLTLVPPFATPRAAGSPPERASLPTKRTKQPVAVCGDRTVHFCGEIGRLVWKYRLADHQDLIANAVRAVAPRPLPIQVDGPHSVHLSMFRQEKGFVIHLVNATGERPLQDVVPVYDVGICLHGMEAGRRACAQTVFGRTELETVAEGESVSFVVPKIETWEMVRVTFE